MTGASLREKSDRRAGGEAGACAHGNAMPYAQLAHALEK
jgi:hypothetical protein